MAFYDLLKTQRAELVKQITAAVRSDLRSNATKRLLTYFSDEDTYIRKSAYLAFGKLYKQDSALLQPMLSVLESLFSSNDFRVRQTVINAAGEIGMIQFGPVASFFDRGLFDAHHSPRNAVIGSLKKMGEKNPQPVLAWARNYLHHHDKEIRREICHGIELRGRTHPQDILPMLRELQHDKTARVKNTLVHVLGQIAYKKGCLATVIADLKTWDNEELIKKAIDEIIDVHHRYRNFSALTQDQAIAYIHKHFQP